MRARQLSPVMHRSFIGLRCKELDRRFHLPSPAYCRHTPGDCWDCFKGMRTRWNHRRFRKVPSTLLSVDLAAPAPAPAPVLRTRRRYFAQDRALERLQAAMPSARLVVMLRDPISRLYSQFYHSWNHDRIPAADPKLFDCLIKAWLGAWACHRPTLDVGGRVLCACDLCVGVSCGSGTTLYAVPMPPPMQCCCNAAPS